jgi:hypothetical protein
MATPGTKTELLIQIKSELTKEHNEFDGNDRVSKKYIAPIYAETGTPCFVVEYIYYFTTNTVKGRSEGYDVWQSSFENPDFLVDDLSNQLVDNLSNELVGA